MRINGFNMQNMKAFGFGKQTSTDSVSKSIQNQISNAQKQLQELSSNKDMSAEAKMEKRKEIQQQITDLNNQLREHQLEQRKEKQQLQNSIINDMLGGMNKSTMTTKQSVGSSMMSLISADFAIKGARIQNSMLTKMEGRVGVLEAQIKQDIRNGGNAEAKMKELDEIKEKMETTKTAYINSLTDVNKQLEDTSKTEQETEKADEKDTKVDKKDKTSNDKKVAEKDEKSNIVNDDLVVEKISTEGKVAETSTQQNIIYPPMDIKV